MSELETTRNPTDGFVEANTESAEDKAITEKTSSQIEQPSFENPTPVKSEASHQEAKPDGEIEPIADNSEVSAPGSEDLVAKDKDEVAKDEVAKDEVAKDEVAKDEVAKDEVAKDEVAKDEVAKDEVAKDEVAKDEVAKDEVAKDEVAKDEVAKDEVAKDEVAKDEVAKDEVAKDEVAKDEVAKDEVAKDEVAKDEVAKDEVAKDEATINDTTDKEETKGENKITDDDTKKVGQVEEKVSDYETLSKVQLVDLLEEAVLDPAINKIKTRVSFIKYAFLKIVKEEQEQNLKDSIDEGGDIPKFEPEEDPLYKRFNHAFEKYKHNKAKYLAEQEKLRKKNLETKMSILEELRELIGSEESLKKTYDEFRTLQERWKEIGMVPKSEVNNLWQSYHFLVEKFFDRVKINKELKDLDLKKNLERKVELCEKAEELLLETSITISFKKLQKYHEEWKEIGPVQQDIKDEIWERFKNATDKINERRREYYKKIRDNQETNYQAKLALCEKTEEIIRDKNQNIKDWQGHTDEMNGLLKLWKSIGPVPRKYNTAIWERFKTALDTFFSDKKDYYGEIKDQQVNNYNLKLELCIQAEALKESSDWKITTQQLINLQKEWKNIGPVPRKHSNRIWKRFRAACDEFFNRKAEYFANIHKHEDENLRLKKDLIEKVSKWKFSDVKKENLNIIKEFQREWMAIGHVPIREKDNLHNEFRSAINKHYDKLNIDAVEISSFNYKTKLESVRNSPDGYKILKRERGHFSNKLNQMREDIMLWENNIGFLADSKNAQILKIEFEKKINNAKKELIILEAKLKILNEQNS